MFQAFHLLPALTALENVLVPLLARRVRGEYVQRARDLLREVGLEHRMGNQPSQLSGGEQQRVAIARALVGRPRLVLADEPTGALDSATGTQILDQLLAMRKRHGVTLIVATHDDAVSAVCDRVVGLRDGRAVADSA